MFKVIPHEPKSLSWWFEQRVKIDMTPTYQRRSDLWNKSKQAFLIDSIINDYDMPKFYLADFNYANTRLNKKKKPYAVIDGKQRFQAINAFFSDQLPLNSDFVYASDPSLRLAGLSYVAIKLTYPEVAEKIEKHIPAIMSVISDEESKIRQLFVRLNIGISANGAERRNAMDGIVPDLIRSLAGHQFFTSKIKFNVSRMAEFNVVGKLLLIEHRHKFVDTKAGNLDALVREGEKGFKTKFKNSKTRVEQVLQSMMAVFNDSDPLLSSGGSIPLYYWLVKHNKARKDAIRPFLEAFVAEVQANQRLVREHPDAGDSELSAYYTMGRTTNDQASLEGRYRILEKRFSRFSSKRKRQSRP
jgi:hypothetical protein